MLRSKLKDAREQMNSDTAEAPWSGEVPGSRGARDIGSPLQYAEGDHQFVPLALLLKTDMFATCHVISTSHVVACQT